MENELKQITIGHTKVVNGYAVTRWSTDSYEVGTWGRETMTLEAAASRVAVVEDLGACFERNIARLIF